MCIVLLITFMDKQDLNYKTVVLDIETSKIIKVNEQAVPHLPSWPCAPAQIRH